MSNIFKAVIMLQINNSHEMINFTLFFNISKSDESRRSKIKDKLYGEEKIHSVASINPEDRIYEIKTTSVTMETILESLKPLVKVSEYMICFSSDIDDNFNICYGPKNNEAIVELL